MEATNMTWVSNEHCSGNIVIKKEESGSNRKRKDKITMCKQLMTAARNMRPPDSAVALLLSTPSDCPTLVLNVFGGSIHLEDL